MVAKVVYYLAPMDSIANTSTRALRESPIRLFLQDAGVLVKMFRFLPYLVLPYQASSTSDELYLDSFTSAMDLLLQGILFVFEVLVLFIAPLAVLIFPGFISILGLSLAFLAVYFVTWPIHGPTICYSKMGSSTSAMAATHTDERWLFVNGCATDHVGLQKNIDYLSKCFGRNVIGIHNKSYGLIADLLECLIQRCFAYKTNDVRVFYNSVKPFLLDPAVAKVVLLGHSQGGIIISLVIDSLLAEMPSEIMSKLEIYTFGSAASHFSNPAATPTSNAPSSSPKDYFPSSVNPANQERVIKHIEHYANEYDLIPRWGVLHSVCQIQSNRYSGSVFVRAQASGHLLNQHYLSVMFPLLEQQQQLPLDNFLDQVASVNIEPAGIRIAVPVAQDTGLLTKDAVPKAGDGQITPSILQTMKSGSSIDCTTPPSLPKRETLVMIFSRSTSGAVVSEVVSGKTVRELSRLWKYLGGDSPEDGVPGTVNEVKRSGCFEEQFGSL